MEYSGIIFDLLDKWRHFPSYQLERRADIFFAAFLPDLIDDKYKSIPRTIIPEYSNQDWHNSSRNPNKQIV